MESPIDLLFMVNIAFLVIGHELDAIKQREWRFFFSRIPVSDETAYRIFTALHVPLFIAILWNLHSFQFQIAFDTFLIIHAGLHWALRNHPLINFNNWFSQFWIIGGAILGSIHLGLLFFT